MCLVRGKPLPLVRLGELFGVDGQRPGHGGAIAVVVRDGQRRCCLLVDALLGQQQVVLKPMGPVVGDPPGICGGTVLGDGRIALVLDVPGLVRRAGGRRQKIQARTTIDYQEFTRESLIYCLGHVRREGSSGRGKYLTFTLGPEEYGLPILKIREIIQYLHVTPVPGAAANVGGVIDLRGQVIAVTDLPGSSGSRMRSDRKRHASSSSI